MRYAADAVDRALDKLRFARRKATKVQGVAVECALVATVVVAPLSVPQCSAYGPTVTIRSRARSASFVVLRPRLGDGDPEVEDGEADQGHGLRTEAPNH